MFKVETADGPKYMVQMTSGSSYRMRGLFVKRGGTLTISKRLRDYLVKSTPHFSDFDPTPAEAIDEILPPQFGEEPVPDFDEADFNMKTNPALTIEQATALAAKDGKEVATNEGSGDMSMADLHKNGGATAPAKKTAKAAPLKVTVGGNKPTETKQAASGPVEVS